MDRYTATVTATGQVFAGISEATLEVLRRTFGEVTIGDAHSVSVVTVTGRYPYRPTCTCGHQFRGYAAKHAALVVANDHLATSH